MKRLFKEMFILALTAVAVIYLLNPDAGLIELIPDFIPIIGNLDEAAATLIILNTLRYYGLDLDRLWGRPRQRELRQGDPELPDQS